MKKILNVATNGFIAISALSLLSVSIMAFINPQSVMNLVDVQLNNTDAYSSIRGIYGGVGLTIFISLIWLMKKDHIKGLVFLALLWGSYAVSRLITIMMEGALGQFGNQWLITEIVLFFIALGLLVVQRRKSLK